MTTSKRPARPLDALRETMPTARGDEYLITDEPGVPVHPEWYSDEFARLLKRMGLRKIRLHDSRHTTLRQSWCE